MDRAARRRLNEALERFVEVLEDIAQDAKTLRIREEGLYGDGTLEVTLVKPWTGKDHILEVTEVKITIPPDV